MKEVEKALRDRLKEVLVERNYCLCNANYYLHNCCFYSKCEIFGDIRYRDFDRYRGANHLSDLYRRISLYRDEIKVLVKVLKIMKKNKEK